ncbi:MAG: FtsX-like permease family protein [Candidatus Thorarchaeota archaeon]
MNDVITMKVVVRTEGLPGVQMINRNITVAGVVEVPLAYRYALLQYGFSGILMGPFGIRFEYPYNMILVDWEKTVRPMLEEADNISGRTSVTVVNTFQAKIDRARVIDPYNIPASNQRVEEIRQRITAKLSPYSVEIDSMLTLPLTMYTVISAVMNLVFISLSLPIFFMTYFTGTLVSDMTYNLRRREIGLLLTKGYRRDKIRNIFLIEGALIGAMAGAAAVFLGSIVAWATVAARGTELLTVVSTNPTSVVLSIALGMALALISVYRPANRASRLEILDALKHYVYVEETSEYKRFWPTVFLLLGTYKLVVWGLGVDVSYLLTSLNPGNLFLAIGIIAWIGVDAVLNYVGPLFFLYGATKVFMRGSTRFQELIVMGGKRIFGAFGTLATRNVRRNPARNAAMVFLLSLIVSYGVFTIGSLYSDLDHVQRDAYYTVGSDVRLQFGMGANVSAIVDEIRSMENVAGATVEYRISLVSGSTRIAVRAISPDEWRDVAFWESDWFVGNLNEMFSSLDEDGILLSLSVAKDLRLNVGDTIHVSDLAGLVTRELKIVGLVGHRSLLEELFPQQVVSVGGDYPSFVSVDFLRSSGLVGYSQPNVLIRTLPGTNGTLLQEQLMNTYSSVASSYSYTSQMAYYNARPIQSGVSKIQRVSVFFAAVLAVVGSGLVIVLTLKEKDQEVALLTVRGFNKWQLFLTLTAEVMILVVFSIILGSLVGLIQIFGNVSQLNNSAMTGLIRYRIVLMGEPGLYLLMVIGVVILAAIVPVWRASLRPEEKVILLRS